MNGQNEIENEILQARARALAKKPESPPEAGSMIDLLEFYLARERYAVETSYVQEVGPFKELTPIPCTPAFIRGVVNVRGRILPVLDLKRFFGLPEQGVTDLHNVILVRGHGLELGLLADGVVGVKLLPAGALQGPLPTLTGVQSDYLKGITVERLVVLDLARILSDPKIIVNEEVAI